MRSRYEAYMDGNPLSHVNPNLLILDISHTPGDMSISTTTLANRNGLFITDKRQKGSSVTILFELHLYSIAERQRAFQDVVKWANGRVLETNDREGQRLFVKCTNYPKIDSVMQWTGALSVTFTAFEKPYWEEKYPVTLTLTGTTAESALFVPGNAGNVFPDITITPNSTMANISLICGNTAITLTGCGATSSNPVVITHDDNGFLSIKVGTTSILDKRTGSDELLLECGKANTISYTSSANVTVAVSAKGAWM